MNRTCAQPFKSCQVVADRVALVLGKTVSGMFGDRFKIMRIPSIREFVEVDDALQFAREPLQNKIGPDEASATRNQNQVLHFRWPRRRERAKRYYVQRVELRNETYRFRKRQIVNGSTTFY